MENLTAEEFRIGNLVWVHYDLYKNEIVVAQEKTGHMAISKIIGISPEKAIILFKGVERTVSWPVLTPIEVSEGALIKLFGFIGLENEGITLVSQNNNYFASNGGIELISDIPIKYIHQLQNLYFALNGEELKAVL